jgi:hypothetical protein
MKAFLLILTTLFLMSSCGRNSEDAIPVNENLSIIPDDQLRVVEVACDVFSEDHNKDALYFQDALPSSYQNCQGQADIHEDVKQAVLESYQMAYEIFSSFDKEANKSCVSGMRQVIKTSYQIMRRALRPVNEMREKQQILAKSALDNHLRGLIAKGCILDFESFTYTINEEKKTFSFTNNHLRNGSFEIIKSANNNQWIELGRQWTLLESKKVPGWKIKAVNAQEGKRCDLLEIQGAGVTTTVPDGRHIVELDGHCQNESGSNTSGDARVEISQHFFVKAPGAYRIMMKAQKRGGTEGELQIAVFQKRRNKSFTVFPLSDQAQWNNVCMDIEIDEVDKAVQLAIRDGDDVGRSTYGLLLDEVIFEEGNCL